MTNKNTRPDDHILVIFGATGDLSKRKLMPSLYALEVLGLLPKNYTVLGVGRSSMSDDSFRSSIQDALQQFAYQEDKEGDAHQEKAASFLKRLCYQQLDINEPAAYTTLSERMSGIWQSLAMSGNNAIFYLSTPPDVYEIIPRGLAGASLNKETDGWRRLIVEKPFGYDLQSAIALNEALMTNWQEEQIYRIDHYLGKETVQNVLVTRFSNGIFEPLWNRNYIHHVEVTSAENFGVGSRGGYYEGSGALRDMVQNHLLQLVSLIAMEPPASMSAEAIRNETVKVLQSLRPIPRQKVKDVAIRGQYVASTIRGKSVLGYRDEEGVSQDSKTETYAAIKFYIDNWRWGGVPFYIRSGKYLPTRVTEAVIHFKPTPHYLFTQRGGSCDTCNQLIIRIQPDEGILLKFGMKTPGTGFNVQNVSMDFHYSDLSDLRIPDAYERLLLDSMIGDSTLYARIDAVMAAWEFITPILDAWKDDPEIPLHGYPAGSWGPDTADDLIEGK
jgi:glucose-6-phosphate 1-dehydrogenase